VDKRITAERVNSGMVTVLLLVCATAQRSFQGS
jgi:hypothetical protein